MALKVISIGYQVVRGLLEIIAHTLKENLLKVSFTQVTSFAEALLKLKERGGRLWIIAAGRSREAIAIFGHLLARLGFDVKMPHPSQLDHLPQANDLILVASGSGRTTFVLWALENVEDTDIAAITAHPERFSDRKIKDLIHIIGQTKDLEQHSILEEKVALALPSGSSFELGIIFWGLGVAEFLSQLLEKGLGKALELEKGATIIKEAIETSLDRIKEELIPQLDGIAAEVDKFIEWLLEARSQGRKIFVAGLGPCNQVLEMFCNHKRQMGFTMISLFERNMPCAEAGDLLVVATTGQAKELVQIIDGAKSDGLRTVVITNSPDCDAAQRSDLVLILPGEGEERFFGTRLPSSSHLSFSLNTLAFLEAIIGTLLERLGMTEEDLIHTKNWQGA